MVVFALMESMDTHVTVLQDILVSTVKQVSTSEVGPEIIMFLSSQCTPGRALIFFFFQVEVCGPDFQSVGLVN